MSSSKNKVLLIVAALATIALLSTAFIWWNGLPSSTAAGSTDTADSTKPNSIPLPPDPNKIVFKDENGQDFDIEIVNSTYLSNERRNYYGDSLPNKLDVIWRLNLGSGKTTVGSKVLTWSGAGWTGQPLVVIENGKKYIIQGAFDHRLKKIDYETGEIIWQYRFNDVVKGTGSLWINHKADSLKDRLVILQGTRAGGSLASNIIDSYRGISYFTGEELWRLNSPRTQCYSRDVDGSALMINDTAYLALETSIFAVFNPDPRKATMREGLLQPEMYRFKDTLYRPEDARQHGGNVVTESSPARLRNHIYLASGSGRIWGYNIYEQKMDWEYFIGSDIDGSAVVTDDSCILISVEKQYIQGQGGILKLDPSKSPEEATVWYLPTENRQFVTWQGGVIGTAGTNEATRKAHQPHVGVTVAIDGFTYVFDLNELEPNKKVKLFDGKTEAATPKVLFKYRTGPSISTPIIVGNRMVVPGYEGLHLFEFDDNIQNFKLLAKHEGSFEATPFVDNGRIFVASRDGNLYCLGTNPSGKARIADASYKTEVKPKEVKKTALPEKVEPKKDSSEKGAGS